MQGSLYILCSVSVVERITQLCCEDAVEAEWTLAPTVQSKDEC